MMSEPGKKLHVALFPWVAFGHIIPFLDLAKHIAQRGHKISFISTPRNIRRLPNIPSNLAPLINLVSLPLPTVEHLPHSAEATIDIPSQKIPYLKIAYDGLQGPLLQFLKTSTPDWIIYDFAPYWLPSIAANLRISRAFFNILAAWSVSFFGSSSSAMINGEDPRTQPEDFTVVPNWIPFPSKVAYQLHEAKRAYPVGVNDSGVSDVFRLGSVIAGCDVIAVRSCNELEADFLRLLGELHCKPALPIGLLPPADFDARCNEDDTWLAIREWLDKQNKGSVVYIAFGSEVELSQPEINELALGLELSGLPFFWVLRKRDNSVEVPNRFKERVEGRGMVWTSWVPQLRILGHESVGGFVTHCGYSSVIEALYYGLTLIMLPITIIDQGLIARVFGEKKVGVEVTRDEEDGSFARESVAESLRMVMVEKEGKVYRDNAKEMSKLFADKDLHDRYIDHFVEFLQNH
ncbi:putative UDP-rhamnose:rhamnosyltransferase 1 [Hevea brasiliensis]|nr:putative UDP-rhamnose:rhamnosyltransferase 1 [Hevea brasiliensis]